MRTPELEEVVLRSLERGLTLATVADIAGITLTTLRNWRIADEDFDAACKKAKGECIRRATDLLMSYAQNGDSKALMFFLARRCRDFHETALEREMVQEGETASTGPRKIVITLDDGMRAAKPPQDEGEPHVG